MRPVLEDWTIVVVGSWNVAILNPDWIGREMMNLQEVEIELIIGQNRPVPKVNSQLVSVTPSPNIVIISARQPTDESLKAAEDAACRMLEKLPITPVSGVGINFGYVEETANISEIPLSIKSTSIVRQLEYDSRDINFRITQTADARLRIHLNYHAQLSTATAAREALMDKAISYSRHSKELLHKLYNFDLDESE